jgi:hypothetical protein|tara:strand:- start:5415 stop:5960 length:546 start_codon:yes stop_codon:yes gene_type:complete
MEVKSLENFLDKFGQRVVDKAQAKLYKEKGNTALGQSIRFEVVRTETGFSTKFYMLDYGTFLDKGVSGNKKKRSYKNYKGTTESSPYSYTTKGPPIDILSKWVKKKGLKPKGFGRGRDKDTGRYLSGLAIYISHKIKVRGIPSLSFFQQPLGVEYEKLKEGMLNELKLDIESYLTTFYRPK